jgi:hypothetical protein
VVLATAPFAGDWQGTDPDDGSLITMKLARTGNNLEGEFNDTFSRTVTPGFHGHGLGKVLSATSAEIVFDLVRHDGVTMRVVFDVTLSPSADSTLTLVRLADGVPASGEAPIVLRRE